MLGYTIEHNNKYDEIIQRKKISSAVVDGIVDYSEYSVIHFQFPWNIGYWNDDIYHCDYVIVIYPVTMSLVCESLSQNK